MTNIFDDGLFDKIYRDLSRDEYSDDLSFHSLVAALAKIYEKIESIEKRLDDRENYEQEQND